MGTLNIKCHIIIGIQKGTIILTTTHMSNHQVATAKHFGALNWLLDREFDSLWRPCSSLRAAAGRFLLASFRAHFYPLEEKLQRDGFCKELSTPMLPAASRAKVSMALTWMRWETICRGSGCFYGSGMDARPKARCMVAKMILRPRKLPKYCSCHAGQSHTEPYTRTIFPFNSIFCQLKTLKPNPFTTPTWKFMRLGHYV